MIDPIEEEKEELSEELEETVENAQELARELGLEPREVKYWVIDNDEMNELASYGGFQERYPHWRWGMQYDRQQKKDEHLGGRIFEMVVNDTPCHAYLQMSNSLADQKGVITHVEAHSDFFANNQWFPDKPDASDMLARHADKIESYMEDPDIARGDVEKWIDNILCLEDNIDQHLEYAHRNFQESEEDEEDENEEDKLANIDVSDEVEDVVFDDEDEDDQPATIYYLDDRESNILKFLIENGKQYNEDREEAEELEDWQVDVLDMLREEAHYFSGQKMTKTMNEGHASYYESLMMADEKFAETNDIIDYADHMSMVLNSPGFNPYKLGKALWEHIDNTVNRREVVDKLLRVEGIEPSNFHSELDFQDIHEQLDKRDSYVPEKRHYSLTRPQNQGFIKQIDRSQLEKHNRYIMDSERYESVSEAIDDVDYGVGWKRMREVRETHNDVMFIDEFLTQEFVDDMDYFTYEYRTTKERAEIASRDVEDVKKKLLLQTTNFGKPTVEVGTGNFNNSGELLLLHQYNGVVLDLSKATSLLERIHKMWGRPVNLATVGKVVSEDEMDYALSEGVEPEAQEQAVRVRYDGNEFEEYELAEDIEERIQAEEIDYDTKPDEWLA